MVLVVLAAVWLAVLLPPWLRSRKEGRPGDSISSFRRQLTVLERATPVTSRSMHRVTRQSPQRMAPVRSVPRSHVAPATIAHREAARARRRQVLQLLVMFGMFVGVLAMVAGGIFIALFFLTMAVLVGYLSLLVKAQRIAAVQYSALRSHRSAA